MRSPALDNDTDFRKTRTPKGCGRPLDAVDAVQGAADAVQGAVDAVQGVVDAVQGAVDAVQGAVDVL